MQRPMLAQLRGITPPEVSYSGPARRRRIMPRNRVQQETEHTLDDGAIEEMPVVATTTDRFRPGTLSPVNERTGSGAQAESRSRGWKVFDKALLVAEVISAIVVTWLVAQYVYTAYIDTTPHRVGPNRGQPVAGQAARTPTKTSTPRPATSTPTLVSEVAPPVQGAAPPAGGSAQTQQGDAGKSDETQPPAFVPQPEDWATRATPSVTLTPTSTPTADPKLLLPARLRIPVMFLDSSIHEVRINMGKWEVSPMDIGHHEGTANPGEVGNVVLAGHRDINSALFRDLDRLQPGDSVFVSNSLREYRYVVTDSFVVTPNHTEVMDPTDDKRVTLITCTPIGLATQRLIVIATLDETYTPGEIGSDTQSQP